MKKFFGTLTIIVFMATLFTGCAGDSNNEAQRAGIVPLEVEFEALPGIDMQQKLDEFASFRLTANLDHLTAKEKEMLPYLFQAADIMNELYWKQAIGYREDFLNRIEGEDARAFAKIHYGPWNRLDGNAPFLTNVGAKPAGANFYPEDMTKEDFEALNDSDKASQYTLIRRNDDGKLYTLWFHEAYQPEIERTAALLRKAANLAEDEGLKKYLTLRADAMLTDDYYQSDLAWMDMKNTNIDIVIGPIENYEDGLFGYKAAYEAFVLIKDPEWSQRLQKFAAMLPELQKEVPTGEAYKKDIPGADSDLNAYDVVYYAGDCNAGSKTIAINLPNDPRVHAEKGTRKLQLKNAMRAKFDKILVPIAEMVIAPEQQKHVTFDAFFSNTMFHEVAHGMGVKNTITGKGTAREALKESYSSIEEGKADIMGLWLVQTLREKGEITDGELMDNYVTFMAGIFRSSRFGAASAHGKANMMRFAFFNEQGAFTRDDDGYYRVNPEKMRAAIDMLVDKIQVIQGDGDYEAAKAWIVKDGVVSPELQADLDRINAGGIPVDIVFEQGPSVLGI
ncbi:MAG TPA: Zn-dependent hydrolase [Bacteroidales bacterium]|nr:Zn-dependent hydrolase [Bacteroidales bacterium]